MVVWSVSLLCICSSCCRCVLALYRVVCLPVAGALSLAATASSSDVSASSYVFHDSATLASASLTLGKLHCGHIRVLANCCDSSVYCVAACCCSCLSLFCLFYVSYYPSIAAPYFSSAFTSAASSSSRFLASLPCACIHSVFADQACRAGACWCLCHWGLLSSLLLCRASSPLLRMLSLMSPSPTLLWWWWLLSGCCVCCGRA